ncbi:MAG: tetratricopeptide repeat protein [Candidatus Eisenbacteria bacterium]|nr:tetratricopeptide repeat protein [Candidatus Eisenbacteria bacterium]
MEKSNLAKRKAQKLAREGQVQQAIEEMRQILAEADVDPYDHVYLGDLLMRVGEREASITSYLEAVRSYEQVGLFRNAIAVGKKVLRIDAGRAKIHRTLGELYDREGLKGEAVPHYLEFLDSFKGSDLPPDDFYTTLDRAAAISGLSVEATLRLADHWSRVRQVDRACEHLDAEADRLEVEGQGEMASELRRRAQDLRGAPDGSIASEAVDAVSFEPPPTPAARPPLASFEHGYAVDRDPAPPLSIVPDDAPISLSGEAAHALEIELEPAGASGPAGVPSPGAPGQLETGFDLELDTHLSEGHPSRVTPPEVEELDGAWGGKPLEIAPEGAVRPESAVFDLDAVDLSAAADEFVFEPVPERLAPSVTQPAPTEPAPFEPLSIPPVSIEPISIEPEPPAGPHEIVLGDSALELDDSPRARAEAAFRAARWDEARGLFQRLHRDHPNDRDLLSRLIEVSREQGDRAGEVLYLGFLGDAWIQEGDLERAHALFSDVLRLDPGNATAQRRVTRFRELGVLHEAEPPEARPPAVSSGVLGLGESLVSVRSNETPDPERDEWLDLEGLLEEFKAGLKNHMDDSDFQGHYDLALSHHQMGLLEEALEELERVFACEALPTAVAQPARELRGLCLMGLERGREAVHEFREAVDQAPEGNARRTSLYHLAKALESVEEWQEACERFETLLREAPGFLDAAERLERCRDLRNASSPGGAPSEATVTPPTASRPEAPETADPSPSISSEFPRP